MSDSTISKTAFARRRGVTPGTVSRWVALGMPHSDGRIDCAKAIKWLDERDTARRRIEPAPKLGRQAP